MSASSAEALAEGIWKWRLTSYCICDANLGEYVDDGNTDVGGGKFCDRGKAGRRDRERLENRAKQQTILYLWIIVTKRHNQEMKYKRVYEHSTPLHSLQFSKRH